MKHGQLQQRLQQILKRRIATMQNRRKSAAVLQTSPGNSNSSNQSRSNTELMAATQRIMAATQQFWAQMQKPVPQMMSGVPNHMLNMGDVACWEGSGFAQNPQPHQNPQTPPNPQLGLRQPTQLMSRPNDMSNSIGNSAMGPPQVMPNPGPSLGGMQRTREAWQQLVQTPPPSDQQQQQVLAIVKSNPQLMAQLFKQRATQQQQQLMLLNEGIHNLNISK